ncbi:hypothetical protein EGW08_006678 [Elysia chlorotica]|uniref:Uncharacterized protein n=1 Tax=Elysia chlorotica TaxID=188477 RepID=A0A433TVF9_ELYCH|nr:hypothetical protein EGW08_006678 [Elysia chlorotica]
MDDEIDAERPAWSSSAPLVQVLLPALCAGFVALVVTLLVCCLTRRASRARGKLPPTSIYSMDTSDDTSECGIYDVIDEVLTTRQSKAPCGLLASIIDCPLSPSATTTTLVPQGHKTESGFEFPPYRQTKARAPLYESAMQLRVSLEVGQTMTCWEDQMPSGIGWTDGKVMENSEEHDNPPICHDDGDYETLDRYWKIKSIKRSAKSPAVDGTVCKSNGLTNTENFASLDGLGVEKCNPRETLMCQLTVFNALSDGCYSAAGSTSSPLTVCLYAVEAVCQNKEDLLNTLQKSKLLVLPASEHSIEPATPKSGNILLFPVTGDTNQTYNQLCSRSEQDIDGKHGNQYAHIKNRELPALPLDSKPKLLRRSTSFQMAKPDELVKKRERTHRRRCSDFIPSDQRSAIAGQNVSLSAEELKRIFAKLGPLPPLPTANIQTANTPGQARTLSYDKHGTIPTTNRQIVNTPIYAKICSSDKRHTLPLARHTGTNHASPWYERPGTGTFEQREATRPDLSNYCLQGRGERTDTNIVTHNVFQTAIQGEYKNCNAPYSITNPSHPGVVYTAPNRATKTCAPFHVAGDFSLQMEEYTSESSDSESDLEDSSEPEIESEENIYFELEATTAVSEDSEEEDLSGITKLFGSDDYI